MRSTAMNWNEWRMRWLFFWLLVAVLAILLVGCSHNPPETIEDPSDYLEKPLDPECDLDDVDEPFDQIDPCDNLLIADQVEIYTFDEPGIPSITVRIN